MGRRLLFVSAGDPSGDNATSRLITQLKALHSDLRVFGLGGPRLAALGQNQLVDSRDLAVLGFWEVARRYFFFRRLLRRCEQAIERQKPSCVLLVDYPGFNLRLAERIKPLGIPIVYYISPQVWAWHRKRVHQIKRLVDLMLLILPFEPEFYRPYGVPCRMVGHYLMEDIPEEYIDSEIPQSNRLAILPGSRPQEVERMLPSMLAAARLFCRKTGMTAVVAGVTGCYPYESLLSSEDEGMLQVEYDDARRILHESRLVLTASGTATLEAGIIGRPMVVVYKTGFLTYHIARRVVKLDRIALVNLVLGEKVVPELIQGQASPTRMAAALQRYVDDEGYFDEVHSKLGGVPDLLGGPGASERAARLVSEYL